MELRVEVTTDGGRLTGTVRRATSTTAHPFSGRLELLARLEQLCEPEATRPDDEDRAAP